MRVVTGHAGFEWIVNDRVDLGKPRRPRWIIGVAYRTFSSFPGSIGLVLERIFDMNHRGAVTGLAGEIPMISQPFRGIDIVVTLGTGLGSRVFYFSRHLFFDGGGSMETGLLESCGDDKLSNDNNAPDQYSEYDEEPCYLLRRFLRWIVHSIAPILGIRFSFCRYRGPIGRTGGYQSRWPMGVHIIIEGYATGNRTSQSTYISKVTGNL